MKEDKRMMWTMLICCTLPFALLLFGWSVLSLDGYLPKILVGVIAVACIWMMLRGHDRSNSNIGGAKDAPLRTERNNKSKHGCCH